MPSTSNIPPTLPHSDYPHHCTHSSTPTAQGIPPPSSHVSPPSHSSQTISQPSTLPVPSLQPACMHYFPCGFLKLFLLTGCSGYCSCKWRHLDVALLIVEVGIVVLSSLKIILIHLIYALSRSIGYIVIISIKSTVLILIFSRLVLVVWIVGLCFVGILMVVVQSYIEKLMLHVLHRFHLVLNGFVVLKFSILVDYHIC